jgi:transposase-like protein
MQKPPRPNAIFLDAERTKQDEFAPVPVAPPFQSFSGGFNSPFRETDALGRADYQVKGAHIFYRYSYYQSSLLAAAGQGFQVYDTKNITRSQVVGADFNSGTFTHALRFEYLKFGNQIVDETKGSNLPLAKLGLELFMNGSGLATGANFLAPQTTSQSNHQLKYDGTKTIHSHIIRYGVALNHIQGFTYAPPAAWVQTIVSGHISGIAGGSSQTFLSPAACGMSGIQDEPIASPASVWRVLKQAGLLSRWKTKPSRKGTGFEQPQQPHHHWHIDVSYINICATFYYLCSVLDGYSRGIVHWELRESMKEANIEVILERAKEKHPGAKPRIISDNGPQFIARDFKEFIRISGMTHVRTSPYYPQSNGKLERWHKSLKRECIREKTPLSLEDAKRLIQQFVDRYNHVRLHSAIGYVTPNDMLMGRRGAIHAARDRKLETARQRRSSRRQQAT